MKINCAYLGFGSIHCDTVQKVISIIYILKAMSPSYIRMNVFKMVCGVVPQRQVSPHIVCLSHSPPMGWGRGSEEQKQEKNAKLVG